MKPVVVSSKGWVVIPARLRRKYNLRPGTRVRIVDYGGVISTVPENDDPVANAAGMLHSTKSLAEALLTEHRAESAC
ncbi:MAG: AbrB/MazE/SpoVT family DNA-binding domain-containing protein [Anaerolineae bacterium]